MVIAQESAQPLAALNMPVAANVRTPREQQDIALPLMILGVLGISIMQEIATVSERTASLCVPKTRFGNSGDEGRQGWAQI